MDYFNTRYSSNVPRDVEAQVAACVKARADRAADAEIMQRRLKFELNIDSRDMWYII